MIQTANGPPNDERGFIHGRIKKAVTGFVTSGFNPLAAASGFLTGGGEAQKQAGRQVKLAQRPTIALPPQRRGIFSRLRQNVVNVPSPVAAGFGGNIGGFDFSFGGGGPKDCGFGRVWDEVRGTCVFGLGEQAGRDDTPIGAAVMGRYGAAEVPGNMVVNRAICRPGMVVADDGLCYNKSQVRNSQRQWPKGRRPLLTGGDMRAISTAARAGARLERTTKRLQKIGLMKKPPPRQKRITSGPTDHHHHS